LLNVAFGFSSRHSGPIPANGSFGTLSRHQHSESWGYLDRFSSAQSQTSAILKSSRSVRQLLVTLTFRKRPEGDTERAREWRYSARFQPNNYPYSHSSTKPGTASLTPGPGATPNTRTNAFTHYSGAAATSCVLLMIAFAALSCLP
jgi:hypothetical protein